MASLASILTCGAEGVDAFPAGAVQLYETVIDEEGDVGAMVALALLLQDGADGVDKNPTRAAHLYERAIIEEVMQ